MAQSTFTDAEKAPPRRIEFMGLSLDNVTFDEAVDRIIAMARENTPRYVVTPNVDHIMQFRKDAKFREVYRKAALVLTDGMPVVWASRLLGDPIKEKVSGSDLFPRVSEEAARSGLSICILGGRVGAAEECARILKGRHPDLKIAGTLCPRWGFHLDPEQNREVTEAVRAASPDILFVALGAPKQEFWMHDNCKEMGVPISLGVGAAVDFVSGKALRAPDWMQRFCLEWLYRLNNEPRRLWKRYLIDDSPFILRVMKHLVFRGSGKKRKPSGEKS